MIIPGGEDFLRYCAAAHFEFWERERQVRYGLKPRRFADLPEHQQIVMMRPVRDLIERTIITMLTDQRLVLAQYGEGIIGAAIVAALDKYIAEELHIKPVNGDHHEQAAVD